MAVLHMQPAMSGWIAVIAAGILHSVLLICDAKTIQTVSVPHDAPPGYFITEIGTSCKLKPSHADFFHLFEYSATGALVTKNHLTDLSDDSYSLVVTNSISDTTTDLHINVLTSKSLVFRQQTYIGTILETENPGTLVKVIGHLCVASAEENVTYTVVSGESGLFKLEYVSYGRVHDNRVRATVRLDREHQALYRLVVQAQSQDGRTAQTQLNIYVLDVNDNIPQFDSSVIEVATTAVQEWDKILVVHATDNDANDEITYTSEGSPDFVIDSTTGEVYSEGDYLFPGSYSFSVNAVDSVGHKSDPLVIHIEVEDATLKFQPSSQNHHLSKRATTTIMTEYDIVENSTSISSLFSVATITPRPQSSTERYKLTFASVDMFQQPDVNGNVYLNPGRRLDYEDINQRIVTLKFSRSNLIFPEDVTHLEVTLRVQDKNDEKPFFVNKPEPYLAAVSTNPGIGQTVYTLYAEDPDQNSRLSYNLESGGEGKFHILTETDPESGDLVGKIITTVSGAGHFLDGMEYTLVVSAQDDAAGAAPPQKSNFAIVRVRVGFRPPQLFEDPYMAKVFENSGTEYKILSPDNSILYVKAKCFQDRAENKVTFDLTDTLGKISGLFSINSRGVVETLQNLDYEEPPNQYLLNVTATEVDTGLSSSAQLLVDVLDVNDNSPTFTYSTYTFYLDEDTQRGGPALPMLVTAKDRDSGINAQLEYSVNDDHFSVETLIQGSQYIGRIRIANTLDYDHRPDHQYRFNVTALDLGEVPRHGLATVIVYVKNVNDEAPVFGSGVDHLYASISEEQTVGSVVTIIQATDPDGDNIKYYFSPRSTLSRPFKIDPDSGLITLTQTLPESVPFYTLNITAYDDGGCCSAVTSLSSETYIIVEIKDTNNNQPKFLDCTYEPIVLEKQPVGTFVVKVTAVDDDRGANGNITYTIVTSPRHKKQFDVDPITGKVVTAVVFNREAPGADHGVSVTVNAADQGKPQSLDSHCTFWVHIGDINDNPPKFDSPSYITSISESSAVVGRRVFAVRATDEDEGKNADVVYTLVDNPGGFFRIERDTGIIYWEKGLFGVNEVNLVVQAEDRGDKPLSTLGSVHISITDRTNHPPTWDSDDYEREYIIKETAPIGYTVTVMRASPNNPAPQDEVTFALIDSMDNVVQELAPFRIRQDGYTVKLLVSDTMNYKVENRYELRLRVTNQANTPLSAEIRPVIVIKDMNNEVPRFEGLDLLLSNSYRSSVPENEPPGQTVMTVKAVDDDHEPPNNLVSYSLLEDKNGAFRHFDIDSTTGVITTMSQFDREDQSVYYIKLMATDGKDSDGPGHDPPNTPNSATAQVQVIIADKNDNYPYFTQAQWAIAVQEQGPDTTGRILTVTARDKDEADSLAYSIWKGNVGNVFGMKQKTGDIYVAKTLDYETPPTSYTLLVNVSDGLYQNTTMVIVNVTDVNDNEPEFDQELYEITDVVEETDPTPSGQFLVQVFATDKDVSRPSNFRFSLSGDSTSPADPTFTVEPDTGRIFLRKKLDRDLPNGRDVYQFNVIAEDEPNTRGALFGYAYVKVMPKDINDNNPVFSGADLQGKVAEHSRAGQSVLTVVATDFDAGPNGTVFYEIDRFGNPPALPGTGEWLFQINSETGLITTKIDNSLDRETTAQYFLQIVAKDHGIEQRSATATVTINIADINDQVPKFVEKIYRVSMSENQRSGPVITVSATDNDIDENARLTYTLGRSDRTYFSIKSIPPNAGELTVYKNIDFEQIEFFNLTVYVQDSDPSHKDEAYIEVTVEDYNDNAPQFDMKVWTLRKSENIPEGTNLWNCSASDRDSGINAMFEYSIDRSTDEGHRFTVNSACEVKIQRGLDGQTLDREALTGLQVEKYEVHILAIDKGYPRQTGTAVLRIFVDDVNDNVPEFKLPHPAMVMEGEAPPKHVITFSATDRDTPKYGPPFHFSLPPCEDNPTCHNGDLAFTLVFNPNGDNKNGTGTVTAKKTFWRDQQKFYYLPVVMSDMRGHDSPYSITGTNTLTIEIGDINNQPHKSGHKEIFVYMYDFKGVQDDLVIGTVYAEDPDDWDVKDKHFYFEGPPVMANYFSVDFNDGSIYMDKKTPPGRHSFVAKVWDFRVFTKINATCTVTVTVEEITDEAVYSSGSLRLAGITAEQFVSTPRDKPNDVSKYYRFQKLMAKKLNVPHWNVQIFSVMNGEGNAYTDIRYAVHGSPYYQPAKLNGIVSLDKHEFETSVGLNIAMININMCMREMCESGGCANILVIGDQPNYVNTNGSSFIGVSTSVQAECQCRAQNFSSPPACTPGYCHNGGQCIKDVWGDVKCINCPAGFDGARCQQTRHSFHGGYALYSAFEQCEDSSTSIEILSKKSNGLIFYNGPVAELSLDEPTDFIALWLQDGYPVLQIDHGSGLVTLSLDGRNTKGNRPLQKLDDGRWHHIDIIRKAKVVRMVVDRCEMAGGEGPSDVDTDRSSCEVSGETPGENLFLNVNTMLQLGGRYVEPSRPDTVTSVRYQGCVRNLVHNGQLYDLHSGLYSKGENHLNGCPDESKVCGVNSLAGRKCGQHGVCEITDLYNRQYKCTCQPGWRTSGPSDEECDIKTTVRDMQESSFLSWSLRYEFLNSEVSSSTTLVQLNFRTRDPDGILLHLPSNNDEFITLELVGGHVQVLYNLGDRMAKGDGDYVLTLSYAAASNGQWHTLYLHRIGRWFQLRMDSGEGRYYNETWGPNNGHRLITLRLNQIVAGAHVVFSKNPIAAGQDLNSTCINDVRLNNEWFPMQNSENELSYAAMLEYERNVVMDCTRDSCHDVHCPTGAPYSMICHNLWDAYECRCPLGTYPNHYDCLPIDYCHTQRPCFEGAICITKPYPTNFTCVCPVGWTGRLCNLLSSTEPANAGITAGFIIIIAVCIFLGLMSALVVFLWVHYRKRKDPEKYILDADDEYDIRENVMNYDEEGAGEEDQDLYDINRLRKPDGVDIARLPFEPLTADRRQGRTPVGERPDVATFIGDRLNDANYDPSAPPHDSVREFVYEGGGSDTGSLSSLQTSSSQDEQDYDYLNDWGPKFSMLATMYGGDEDD